MSESIKEIPEQCSNCKFFREHVYEFDGDSVASDAGDCRRNPPRVVPDNYAEFPLVIESMWCGEFQSKT